MIFNKILGKNKKKDKANEEKQSKLSQQDKKD
jgi:hypothetical protein